MIIIRVGLASDGRLPIVGTIIQQSLSVERTGREDLSRARTFRASNTYEMKNLEIEINQYFETDADSSSVIGMDHKPERREATTGGDGTEPSSELK